MEIFIAVEESYLPGVLVTVESCIQQGYYPTLLKAREDRLDLRMFEKLGCRIELIDLPKNLPKMAYLQSDMVYARLVIPSIRPIGWVMYVDSDVVIVDGLRDLEEIPKGMRWMEEGNTGLPPLPLDLCTPTVACEDMYNNLIGLQVEHCPPELAKKKALSSGLMLMNTGAWNAQKISEKALHLLKVSSTDMMFLDQSALSMAHEGNFLSLSRTYCCMSKAEDYVHGHHKVLHYHGKEKPWIEKYRPEIKPTHLELWDQYFAAAKKRLNAYWRQ